VTKSTKAALENTRSITVTRGLPFQTGIGTNSEKGRVTIDLGPDLYRIFKTASSWHGEQMSDVIRDLVSTWVANHPIQNDAPTR
jgi:hypothetical protein